MFLWNYLKLAGFPVVIYGTGNGADKIFSLCELYGIPVSAVFASGDHQTEKLFHDMPVLSYEEIRRTYKKAAILLAFGVYQEDILQRINGMARDYEFYVPDLPLTGGPLLTPEWIEAHQADLEQARSLLCDHASIECFDRCLENKLTGALSPLQEVETDRTDDMRELLRLTDRETYLDLGAYTGDTIREFLDLTAGNYQSITALEADAHNFRKLQANTKDLSSVTLLPYAAWKEDTELTFSGKGGRNCAVLPEVPGRYTHLHTVKALTVDSLEQDFSFIKFDIEGAEAEALQGMKQLLNRCHPKLMVSVYHKTDDFVKLPLLIAALCPGYRMYLRKNPCLPAWELQLYCIYPQA